MIKELKRFLICNKNERTGIFVLITFIFMILVADHFISPALNKAQLNDPLLIAKIDSIMKADSLQRNKPDSLFTFDPNTIDIQEWVLLGLTEAQARVIMNYKKAGGKFYNKEDVKKLYSIQDKMYRKLEPYILIRKDTANKQSNISYTAKNKQEPLELNAADSSQLTGLYGIGPVFARRIILYRELLGGFFHKDQLLEIYGMDLNRLSGFADNIIIDTSQISKRNLSIAEFRELLKHPYISYELTRFICNNRNNIQNQGLSYLLKFEEMNDSLFQKITPYLSVN